MFDAMKLLGSIAESQSAPSAGNRFGTAVQQGASGGMLQQMLSQLGGAGAQQGGGLNSLLGGLTGQAGGSPAPGSAQGGGLGPCWAASPTWPSGQQPRRGRRSRATTPRPSAVSALSRARCSAAGAARWAAD